VRDIRDTVSSLKVSNWKASRPLEWVSMIDDNG
jgi:hypothetical protein